MIEQIRKTEQKIETSQRGEWYNEIAQKTIRPPSTKGDVSCLQCKTVGRYLQDPKCIAAQKSFIRCLSGIPESHYPFCLYARV